MRRYDSYKNSGVEWIGEIPEGWEVKRLKYVAKICTEKAEEDAEKVALENIESKTGRYIETETVFDGDGIRFSKGSILYGKLRPYLAKVWVADFDGAAVGDFFVIATEHHFSSSYLKYRLLSAEFTDLANGSTFGSKMPRVDREFLTDLPFSIPPLSEQTAIASFLDRKTAEIDQLIANKEKLIALYEEEKTAIINRAVTRGLDPDVKTKPSSVDWLGDIPERWEVKRFKYLGKFTNGYSFNSSDFTTSGVRVMKISNIQTMKLDWSDESFVEESFYEKYDAFRVQRNDLVFALTRPIISTGIKAAIVDTDESILLNQRNSMFKATDKVHTKWMYYLILNNQFVQEFDKQIDKTGQQPNISSNDIAEISVPVPTASEQMEIIEHIETECARLDSIIDKFKKQIELFKEYRTTLISEVVTGKIDVRGEVGV